MNLSEFTLEAKLKDVERILVTVDEDKIYYENLRTHIIKQINELIQPELNYSLMQQ